MASTQGSNGFWLKVLVGLVTASIAAGAGAIWSNTNRITTNEAVLRNLDKDLDEIKSDVKTLLMLRQQEHRP